MSKFTLVKLDGTKVPVELSEISMISGLSRSKAKGAAAFTVVIKGGDSVLITGGEGKTAYQRLKLIDAYDKQRKPGIAPASMELSSPATASEDIAFTGFGRCLIGAASLLLVASIVTGFVFLFLEVTKGGA